MLQSKKTPRYLFLFKRYQIVVWRHQAEYRKEFFIAIIDFFIFAILSLVFWQTIFLYIPELKNWTFSELAILSVLGSTSWALGSFFAGFWEIPRKVRNGEFDKYLTRPIHPVFALVAEEIQLDECIKGLIVGTFLIYIVATTNKIKIEIINWVLAFVLLIVGTIIISLIKGSVALLVFWIGRTSILNQFIFLEDYNLERYPITVFPKLISYFFTLVLPIAFISTFPAMILLGKTNDTIEILFSGIFLIIFWLFIIDFIWVRALKHYDSVGG